MTNNCRRSVLHLGGKWRSETNEFLSLARGTERHSKESRHLRRLDLGLSGALGRNWMRQVTHVGQVKNVSVATGNPQSAIPSFRLIDSRTFADDHLCLSPNKSAAQSAL